MKLTYFIHLNSRFNKKQDIYGGTSPVNVKKMISIAKKEISEL